MVDERQAAVGGASPRGAAGVLQAGAEAPRGSGEAFGPPRKIPRARFAPPSPPTASEASREVSASGGTTHKSAQEPGPPRRCAAAQTTMWGAAAIGNYDAVTVVPHLTAEGQSILVTSRPVAALEVLFRFTGDLIPVDDRSCLQVAVDRYVTPKADDLKPPWIFMNHSFRPTVRLSHPPLEGDEHPVLVATAVTDMPEGAELTFDYTMHEYIMVDEAIFTCSETGLKVRGFHFLDMMEKETRLENAMEHVKFLHQQHLDQVKCSSSLPTP
jgi:hypothetical protein